MNQTPAVSIGLPVYNGERYLSVAIESVLDQTFGDFELLISDNASTDRTWEICEHYASKDGRIVLFRNSVNIGAIANAAKLARLATGRYFMWLAHDDILREKYVATCYDFLESHQDYLLCCTRMTFIDEQGFETFSPPTDFNLDSDNSAERFLKCLESLRVFPHAIYGLMRKELCDAAEFDQLRYWPEVVLLVSFSLRGRMGQIDRPLFLYRRHEGQTSRQTESMSEIWERLLGVRCSIPLLPRMQLFREICRHVWRTEGLSLFEKARLVAVWIRKSSSLLGPSRGDLVHMFAALAIDRPFLNRHLKRVWHLLKASRRWCADRGGRTSARPPGAYLDKD